MSRRSLENARVLLTGASSGIGRELALALARRQARLLLVARREELLRETVEQCRLLGSDADYLAGDVTDPADRDAAIYRLEDRWQGLDVLVNNAGASAHGLFADSDEHTMRGVMEVNFFAPVEFTRRALPLLLRGRNSAIVNIGSIIGHRGLPFNSEYAASKFALRGWSESLRAELIGDGIDVLMVSPGTTDTEFFDHLLAKRASLPWADRAGGIPPAAVAEQTVRALERGRREIYPNWRGHTLVLANRLFPGLIDRIMGNFGRRR